MFKKANKTQLQGKYTDYEHGPGQRSQYSDWLQTGRLRGWSSSPGRVKNFLFLHVIQTGSEVHPTYYPMGNGAFPRGKAARA
jgi:hypothetical protein